MTPMRGSAATTATVIILLLSGCASGSPGPEAVRGATGTVAAPGEWVRIADFPLEPREHPVTLWTGTELLVLGGYIGPSCPPTADCAMDTWAADGAALDPATGEWRVLSEARTALRWADGAAFAEGMAYVNVSTEETSVVLTYDVAADRWSALTEVPDVRAMSIVADAGRLLFISGSDEFAEYLGAPRIDQAYDIASGTWTALPDDPLGPSYSRSAVSTPHGVVLSAGSIEAVNRSDPDFEMLALLSPGTDEWVRLPDTGSIHSETWIWSGSRLVDPSLGGADGGEVDGWGREHPNGGLVTLPDGAWSELPDAPAVDLGTGWLYRVPGERYSVSAGYVFDDLSGAWTPLPQPADVPDEPGSAAWAGDHLVLIGGTDWDADLTGTRSPAVWVFAPAG